MSLKISQDEWDLISLKLGKIVSKFYEDLESCHVAPRNNTQKLEQLLVMPDEQGVKLETVLDEFLEKVIPKSIIFKVRNLNHKDNNSNNFGIPVSLAEPWTVGRGTNAALKRYLSCRQNKFPFDKEKRYVA